MALLADYGLNVTLVSLFIWIILFPALVQGLIAYAIYIARGEKRDNDRAKAGRRIDPSDSGTSSVTR
jgi:phage shock protein PspC (stress-responsive transcriptional regulator)